MSELVLVERRADGVAVVTLNNPKVNALSQAVLSALYDVALDLTVNPPGAVVITGGDRLLAAGADISEFGEKRTSVEAREIYDAAAVASGRAWAGVDKPIIAKIDGFCIGGKGWTACTATSKLELMPMDKV